LRALALLAPLWLAIWPGAAHAEERPKIMVMFEQASPAYLPRLRAELTMSGYPVVVARAPSFPPNRQEVEVLARQEGATIGLSLVEAGAGVEVWVMDPATTKTIFREVLLGLYDPRENPDVIALRVVETLRANLMEVERTHPIAATVEQPPQEIDLAPRHPSRFMLAMGGGVGYSPGGVAATGHVGMSFQWWATPRLGLSLDGLVTPEPAKLRGSEGVASLAWYWVGPSGAVYLTDPTAPFRLRAGAGVWLSVMTINSEPAPSYFTRQLVTMSAIPHMDLAPIVALSPRLTFAIGASLGIDAPSTAIQFGPRRIAEWGRPLLLGLAALSSTLD
jgi:hypothetical protein